MKFPVHTVIFLILIIGIFVLQYFLSKREVKWPGLVLPILFFLFSLLIPFNYVAPSTGVDVGVIMSLILIWILSNIPTVLLLVIYFSCREKQKCKKQVDKMNIIDLD